MNLEITTKNDNTEVINKIIGQIRDLINFKNLEPGDKLPAERMMSEKFGVTRGNVREAIHKLEFYGILISKPQSGTFVANIGVIAMNGIIDDIVKLNDPNFKSLVETRILLELKTSRLAALRRTDANLEKMKYALDAYVSKVEKGEDAVQEDLLFHLAIAEACGNDMLNKLMLLITPQIITNFEKFHVCDDDLSFQGIKEHQNIFDAIEAQDAKKAKQMMKVHFKMLYQFCYNVTSTSF